MYITGSYGRAATVSLHEKGRDGPALQVADLKEAAIGIEPMDKGFADLCLTTWLRRPK
jgi:hypothetical protein